MREMDGALSIVEVQGLPPAVVVADAMVKSAAITLIALEVNTLGALTIKASGDTAAVAAAHDAGKAIAGQLNALVGATVIPRYSSPAYPMWIACKPSISGLLKSRNHLIPAEGLIPADDRAMGMLETRGFAGAVAALDTMLKSGTDSSPMWDGEMQVGSNETVGVMHDGKGNYRGTLEVSQDVTAIRKLKGEKRLLDE